MPGKKRVRVEIALLDDDVLYLDRLAESQLTTRGDLIREAIYSHFPQLRERQLDYVGRLIRDVKEDRQRAAQSSREIPGEP